MSDVNEITRPGLTQEELERELALELMGRLHVTTFAEVLEQVRFELSKSTKS